MGERLKPRVEFWIQVYSRLTTDQALLHDADDPSVVYQAVNLEGRQEWREIEKFVEPIRQRYAELLGELAEGAGADPTGESARVLALFGSEAGPERLRRASESVRFQRGQADSFLEGLVRRGAYEPHLRRIFTAAGLPMDLTYLPHVESSFRPQAYSRSGAAGIWQFTRSTGRHYLRIMPLIDERWDPIDASRAAARLLRRNYQELGSWPLALTAYNHGLAGMKRAVARLGTHDLQTLIERYEGRSFGFASKSFYAEFLAAREVASNAEKYFGHFPRWTPLQYQELALDRPARAPELARALGLSICDLLHYNPALRQPALEGERALPTGFRLKLPAGGAAPGTSIAALLAPPPRPSRLSGAAEPRRRDSPTPGLEAAPPRRMAALGALPAPGPASRRTNFQFDSEARQGPPGGPGPRPQTPAPPPVRLPSVPGLLTLTPSHGAGPAPREVGAAEPAEVRNSPWQSLGASLPLPLRLHPDWSPWMRPGWKAGLPPALGREALRSTGGRIQVEPDETLPLLAMWLRLPSARLKELNGLRAVQQLRLGQWLRVDFSRISEEEFLERRLRFQRDRLHELLRHYRVTSTQLHRVRRGDTLWSICRLYGDLPLGLLRWYNEGLAWLRLSPGSDLVVPVVERYTS